MFVNIKNLDKSKEYRYRGFHNGEDHNELVTVTHINLEDNTITFSNNIATCIEDNGDILSLVETIDIERIMDEIDSGQPFQRLITYCDKACIEHIQKNKKETDCYERYALPTNRDKSLAVKWNEYLTKDEVINIILKNVNKYKK